MHIYIHIYINTELLNGNQGHQEETHHPTHRFRRLFLDLLSMGWRGCASVMGAIKLPPSCSSPKHIVTKIHCDHTFIGGDMGHQPQGNRRKAVYLNITGRGPRMALDNISCLLKKTACIPNYFLQWIYFAYSCLPDVKI